MSNNLGIAAPAQSDLTGRIESPVRSAMPKVRGYQLINLIGRGATASVYSASSGETGQKVALKIFSPEYTANSVSGLPAREIRALRTLKHPNIVALISAHLDLDPPTLCFQLVEGATLSEFQTRLPFVLPELSVRIAVDILSALEHAHEQKVIHRDLKPSNVLISNAGDVLVTDFGLAKLHDGGSVTTQGALLGSPEYMSPEQAAGDTINNKSDLFSVSSILYFLMTGAPPFSRGSSLATLSAVSRGEFESPEKRNPKISLALSRILCRGLAKNAEDRYESAAQYKAALVEYLEAVGLHISDFTLNQWRKDPSGETLRALKQMSETLLERCETEIGQESPDRAYETLAHLSLVAPSSLSVQRLAHRISSLQRTVRRKKSVRKISRIAAVILLCLGIGSAGVVFYAHSRAPFVPPAPAVLISAPGQASVVQAVSPLEVAQASPIKTEISPQKPLKRLEKIIFDLPSNVQTFWDGRSVASHGTFTALPGQHRLKMIMAGMKPYEQDIEVVRGEPTVIRAQSHPSGDGK